jgi:peptidoglycan/LPS O-acetylase OafA/YrhL
MKIAVPTLTSGDRVMKRIEALGETRLDYIDNLRWAMIALVVGLHAAVTYSHIGSWYYNAPDQPGPVATTFFLVFEVHLQGFFMGFMFLLAGYFVPAAYDRKGFARFLLDRFLRLGVPALAYMLLVHPVTGFFLLQWWDVDFATAYSGFIGSGRVLSASGPMWFAVALLIFSAVYALCRLLSGGGTGAAAPARPGLASLTVLGLGIALVAYLVRIVWPIGTSVFNMQFCYFTQYVVLFAVGILAYRRAWFGALSRRLGLRLFWGALILSPLATLAVLAALADPLGALQTITGRGTWQSAVFALWESLYCVAMCAGVLVLFRESVNLTNGGFRRLTASSFGVYVMHMPVLVAVSLALEATGWPPLGKFALAWPAALALTFLLVEFGLRRIPGVKRFL